MKDLKILFIRTNYKRHFISPYPSPLIFIYNLTLVKCSDIFNYLLYLQHWDDHPFATRIITLTSTTLQKTTKHISRCPTYLSRKNRRKNLLVSHDVYSTNRPSPTCASAFSVFQRDADIHRKHPRALPSLLFPTSVMPAVGIFLQIFAIEIATKLQNQRK